MFTKIIQSGNIVEVYEYEREPFPPRYKRKSKRNPLWRFRSKRSSHRAKKSFIRLVRSNLYGDFPALLTLTMRDVLSVQESYKCFTAFMLRVRRTISMGTRFIAVPEFQKRGAVHFHVLIWGVSHLVQTERSTRLLATLWGHGFVDIIQTDGSQKLVWYLSKYMSKGMADNRLAGVKAFTSSRNCLRPSVFSSLSNPVAIDFINKNVLVSDIPTKILHPLKESVYSTLWLGKATYKLYNSQKYES